MKRGTLAVFGSCDRPDRRHREAARRLRAAILVSASALALAAAGSADARPLRTAGTVTLSLSVRHVQPGQTVRVTASGEYTERSELDVVVDPGTGCFASAVTERLRVDIAAGGAVLLNMLLDRSPPQHYAEQAYFQPPTAGTYTVCAYLLVPHEPGGDPSDPAQARTMLTLTAGQSGQGSGSGRQSGGSSGKEQGILTFGSRDKLIFDAAGLTCVGIDASGYAPGGAGIVCYRGTKTVNADDFAAAVFANRQQGFVHIALSPLTAFLGDISRFVKVTFHEKHLAVGATVRLAGTPIVCQFEQADLDPGHKGIECYYTNGRSQLTRDGGLTGVYAVASTTTLSTGRFFADLLGLTATFVDDRTTGAVLISSSANERLKYTCTLRTNSCSSR
jgi:hypothetical protein